MAEASQDKTTASQNDEKPINLSGDCSNQSFNAETPSLDDISAGRCQSSQPVPETVSSTISKQQPTTNTMAAGVFAPQSECLMHQVKILDIGEIPIQELCKLMNIPRTLGGDYRSLGGELDYSVAALDNFELEKNPTKCLLKDWNSAAGHFASHILKVLRKMRRDDAGDIVEAQLKRITEEKQCNCSRPGCSHLT